MKTLSYILGTEEDIEVGKELYFGQLWDGDGNGVDLLESGAISYYDSETEEEYVIDFEISGERGGDLESLEDEEILEILVRITSIC